MEKNTKKLFRIVEAAHACGVSRSTLMRMEEKGLLKPAYIDPDSGRRYYDNFNIAHILQVEQFKDMGLSNEEIINYYSSGGNASVLLASLEERLYRLQQNVQEMRLRALDQPAIRVETITVPAVTCCIKHCVGSSVRDKYVAMFDFYTECVRNGYELSSDPIFTMYEHDVYIDGSVSSEPYPFSVCVPVRKDSARDSVSLPACRAVSVLYYGDYDKVNEAWRALGKEIKDRNLKVVGKPRTIGIVAPYTGQEISVSRYCSRLIVPVTEN